MTTSHDDAAEIDEAAWDEAVAQVEAAEALIADGSPAEGLATAREAAERLAALVGIVGPTHPDYAHAREIAGDALVALGRTTDAEFEYRTALAIYDGYTEPEEAAMVAPLRVGALTRLGDLLARAARFDAAEAYLREAVKAAEAAYGADASEVADSWNALGVCLRFAGRYDEAAAAYARAGTLRGESDEFQDATHFHNLSGLATARGDFAAAEAWSRQAIAARSDADDFGRAVDEAGLGDALSGLERHAEAEAAYRRALAGFAAAGRPDHPEVAFALHNLADTLQSLGRSDEAEATYRETLSRKAAVLGADHHELAASWNNLALLLSDSERRDEARAAADQALRIARATLPEAHPVRLACERTSTSL